MKILYLFFVLFTLCNSSCNDEFDKIDSVEFEPECVSAGGMCVFAEDCPDEALSPTPGLCPRQQSRGIECCYGLSVKETRCHKRGGDCRAECKASRFNGATDCKPGTICCILV